MRRTRGTGSIYKRSNSPCWYIKYRIQGVVRYESSGSEDRQVAEDLLKARLAARSERRVLNITDGKSEDSLAGVRVSELAEDFLAEYERSGRRGYKWASRCWNKHLKSTFDVAAGKVTTEMALQYIDERRAEEAANATINREMACLRRMFSLASRQTPPKVSLIPYIPILTEAPPRQGFVEEGQFRALVSRCEPWMRVLLLLGYQFGLRKGELLGMKIRQVEVEGKAVNLYPGTTKNDRGRRIVLTTEAHEELLKLIKGRAPDDHVFVRPNGRRVRDFRAGWQVLVDHAGLSGLIFHDLRRSAVRNMVRRGVTEGVAMRISGHLTRCVFDRYNIVSDTDLLDAARKIEQR